MNCSVNIIFNKHLRCGYSYEKFINIVKCLFVNNADYSLEANVSTGCGPPGPLVIIFNETSFNYLLNDPICSQYF